MKIYVSHSKKFDYKNELYRPLRQSKLNSDQEIVLPHEASDKPYSSKDFFKTCHVVIAEVSYPATGLGIELGWADAFGVPIVAVYKKGFRLSSSVKVLTDKILEYGSDQELVDGIAGLLDIF